jgi:hypothetical protein
MLKNRPVLLTVNIFFCLAFIGFAYLNLNDLDPWIWVPLYLVPAYFCGAIASGRFYPKLYLLFIGIFTVMAAYYFFTPDGVWDWIIKYNKANIVGQMHADKPYIEQTREFLGLFIVIVVLLGDYLAVRKS